MTTTGADLATLRATMTGDVHLPGEPAYDEARRVWNAQIDRAPAGVAMCASPEDVVAALAFAREHDLAVTVRGGAHNTSGSAVGDGSLMLNLSRMNGVDIDVANRRARVGGGALLADLDAASQEHGLATTGGQISHTGVGGLTLGGGMGWLSRMHGLSIDNLLSVQIVIADGRVLRASAQEHPDLFWAVRGGGGNFGVVTEFEFALHPVGPMVNVGMAFWEAERAPAAMRQLRQYVPALPRDSIAMLILLNAPPLPFIPEEHHFKPGVMAVTVGFGTPEAHAEQIAQLRPLAPLFEFATPMPYVALQQMQDEATAWGQLCYEKGTQLAELSDGAIEEFVSRLSGRRSPHSMVLLYRLDGAFSEVPEDATAWGAGRSPRYAAVLVCMAQDMDTWAADRQWVRDLWTSLQPYSLGIGDYVNTMADFDAERIAASYGPEKFARLRAIKASYDPANMFRSNANIPPA